MCQDRAGDCQSWVLDGGGDVRWAIMDLRRSMFVLGKLDFAEFWAGGELDVCSVKIERIYRSVSLLVFENP
jgi:hypothetical protein